MNVVEAMKIGNVYISKEDTVHIIYTLDNTTYDITGRVVKLNDEHMLVDNSTQYHASNFQAWYKSITTIELVTPEVSE